jgi:hypothetical protein
MKLLALDDDVPAMVAEAMWLLYGKSDSGQSSLEARESYADASNAL